MTTWGRARAVAATVLWRTAPTVLVRRVSRYWNQRTEPAEWPLPQHRDRTGLERYEYSLYSQNGEDGILRYIFDQIGSTNRRFLEFGFGVTENNSLRLALHDSFGGVFIDASARSVDLLNRTARSRGMPHVRGLTQFLTAENVCDVVQRAGCDGPLDLLSIDVDGNDYWLWQALIKDRARVVVIEYNASLGPSMSVTIPYEARFDREKRHPSGLYYGASLQALVRLGKRHGYALVGCDSKGVNAFFVRQDCLGALLEQDPVQAYRPHKARVDSGLTVEAQWSAVSSLPYVQID